MIEHWTMRDGTKINVDDMTEEHLRNTLKMIIRQKESEPDYNYDYMVREELKA